MDSWVWLVFWFVIMGGGTALVALLKHCLDTWARLRQAEIDARVKQDMLARGLSADEIERLLATSSSSAPDTGSQQAPSKAARSLAAAIEDLVGAGKNKEEIAAFLEVFLPQGGERLEVGTDSGRLRESAESVGRRSDMQRLINGLVPVLESMVQNGRETQEIAAFLDTVLQKDKAPVEIAKDRDQPPLVKSAAEDFRLPNYSVRADN